MNIEECYFFGYTSKAIGKNGEVIIKHDVDSPQEYLELESMFVQLNKLDNALVPFFIEQIEQHTSSTFKVKFEDVNDVIQAKELVGKQLFLPLTLLPKLTGNKFYYHEIKGFNVVDKHKGDIGKIKDVVELPQQAVLQIMFNNKEVLIPINDAVITAVDREITTIFVDAPEGLIDIYLD